MLFHASKLTSHCYETAANLPHLVVAAPQHVTAFLLACLPDSPTPACLTHSCTLHSFTPPPSRTHPLTHKLTYARTHARIYSLSPSLAGRYDAHHAKYKESAFTTGATARAFTSTVAVATTRSERQLQRVDRNPTKKGGQQRCSKWQQQLVISAVAAAGGVCECTCCLLSAAAAAPLTGSACCLLLLLLWLDGLL